MISAIKYKSFEDAQDNMARLPPSLKKEEHVYTMVDISSLVSMKNMVW